MSSFWGVADGLRRALRQLDLTGTARLSRSGARGRWGRSSVAWPMILLTAERLRLISRAIWGGVCPSVKCSMRTSVTRRGSRRCAGSLLQITSASRTHIGVSGLSLSAVCTMLGWFVMACALLGSRCGGLPLVLVVGMGMSDSSGAGRRLVPAWARASRAMVDWVMLPSMMMGSSHDSLAGIPAESASARRAVSDSRQAAAAISRVIAVASQWAVRVLVCARERTATACTAARRAIGGPWRLRRRLPGSRWPA